MVQEALKTIQAKLQGGQPRSATFIHVFQFSQLFITMEFS